MAQKINFDIGEKRHVHTEVKIATGQTLPFSIRAAKWELWDEHGYMEDSGECTIEEHTLDAYICPKKQERYTLKYIYEVADELWIDPIKVEVS